MALIELKDVSKYYNDGATSSKGIENINLTFDRGEFIAITGESGSGKTTLLNLITLMDSYDEGDIIFNGKSTADFTNEDMISFRNDYVSLVFQDYNIVQSVSVLDNVILALLNRNIPYKEAKKEAIEALTKCGLKDKLKAKTIKLSGGEKQRVVIARALALNSPVLAFDEPTGNLDSKTSKDIIELINEIKKDRLILYVTHDYESIENIASRHLVLKDGNVIEDTIIAHNEIINEPLVEKKKKTSVFAVFFSGIKLIFSMPKNFILLLCSLLLFSVIGYVSAIGFGASNPLIDLGVSSMNTTTRVFKSLPDSAVVVSLPQEDYKKDLPQEYFLDEGGYLSSIKVQFWDYVGYTDFGFYLPSDSKMQKEVSGDSGYYILYNSDYLNSYTLTQFKETFIPQVGNKLSGLSITGSLNDSIESIVYKGNQILKNSLLLGIGETSSITTGFQVVLTKDISTELSETILSNIDYTFSNPSEYGKLDFTSIYTNYSLDDLLEIKLNDENVNFISNFKSDDNEFASMYIPEFYFNSLDNIEVTVLNKTMTFKDFYNQFALDEDTSIINDVNSKIYLSYEEIVSLGYQGNIGIYFPYELEELKLILLNKITGFSVIYFSNINDATTFKNKVGEEAHLGNETISRTQTLENYISLITLLLPIIFMIIIFAIVFIFASWVTSMLLRNILNKYSPDFAVLSTLGYRKGSIYSIRLILITVPTAISYILVSTILSLGIYVYLFNYNEALIATFVDVFLPSIIAFFFVLIALGVLISYFIDKKTRKMKTINLLKEAGGSVK